MLFMIRRTIENFEINGGAYFRKQNTQVGIIYELMKTTLSIIFGPKTMMLVNLEPYMQSV